MTILIQTAIHVFLEDIIATQAHQHAILVNLEPLVKMLALIILSRVLIAFLEHIAYQVPRFVHNVHLEHLVILQKVAHVYCAQLELTIVQV